MGVWILWERQRYYRQFVSSVHLMQLGALLAVTANLLEFAHVAGVLRFDFVVASSTPDGLHLLFRALGLALLSAGVRLSAWDLATVLASSAVGVVYFAAPSLALLVYFLQVPAGALLAYNLHRAFQDMRLVISPVVLCLVHAALSALLLATNNVLFHSLRDVLADAAGWMVLSLSVWVVPGAIEWVEDEEITDLQVVGDGQAAAQALAEARARHAVPAGFSSLYEVNRAREDARKLAAIMRGEDPGAFAELEGLYGPSSLGPSRRRTPAAPPPQPLGALALGSRPGSAASAPRGDARGLSRAASAASSRSSTSVTSAASSASAVPRGGDPGGWGLGVAPLEPAEHGRGAAAREAARGPVLSHAAGRARAELDPRRASSRASSLSDLPAAAAAPEAGAAPAAPLPSGPPVGRPAIEAPPHSARGEAGGAGETPRSAGGAMPRGGEPAHEGLDTLQSAPGVSPPTPRGAAPGRGGRSAAASPASVHSDHILSAAPASGRGRGWPRGADREAGADGAPWRGAPSAVPDGFAICLETLGASSSQDAPGRGAGRASAAGPRAPSAADAVGAIRVQSAFGRRSAASEGSSSGFGRGRGAAPGAGAGKAVSPPPPPSEAPLPRPSGGGASGQWLQGPPRPAGDPGVRQPRARGD